MTRRGAIAMVAAAAATTFVGAGTAAAAPRRTGPPAPTHGLLIDIREHGAAGDGVTDDTEVFNAALDAVERNGGGTIYFPRGTYPVGNCPSTLRMPTWWWVSVTERADRGG